VVAVGRDAYITAGPRANLGRYPLNANIFEALTTFDPHFRLQPCLAVSWEYQGERTWLFRLRRNVRFHDGSPLTAAAVRASLEAQAETGTLLFSFERITAPDEHTVAITTTEENLILPYILSHPYMGITGNVSSDKKPIGTGPFRFVRYEKDQLLEVARNREYWGDKAQSSGIVFRFLPDHAARLMAFLAGEADILAEIPWEILPQLQANKNYQVATSPLGTYTGLMLSDQDALKDKAVRKAVAMALDRKAINQALWQGLGTTRQTLLAPSFLGASADLIPDIPYDPAQAKALLKGKKVSLRLIAGFPDAETHGMLPELLQAQLAAAGINVQLQKISDTGLYHSLMKGHKGDLWLEKGNLNSADLTFLPHLLFHSDGFYPKQLGTPAGSERFCSLLAQARATRDDEDLRKNTALALQEIIHEEMLFIPLAELPFVLAAQRNVQVPELHPTLLSIHWDRFIKGD
jgi:peptide/nickel transport system substrate-binding protein